MPPKPPELSHEAGAVPAPFPGFLPPMLATLADAPFSDENWIFEPKLDGYRMLALIRGGSARLLSRNGRDSSDQYPFLLQDLNKWPVQEAILDGEVVALDESGRPCFQCLQDHLKNRGRSPKEGGGKIAVVYYVFDILFLNGYSLLGLPLSRRKKVLEGILAPSYRIRPVEYFDSDGKKVYDTAAAFGLEGIMAKRKDSTYASGQRSADWLKVKQIQSDEFIIAGYTGGAGNRAKTFGALVLGSYDQRGNWFLAAAWGAVLTSPAWRI